MQNNEDNFKPKNRLDQFQSHSVHYVLLAARSTEAIRFFTDAQRASSKEALLAINRTKALGDEVPTSRIGKNASSAFLVIDTRRFSQFTVDNFSMKTYPSGFAVPGSTTPSSTAVDLAFDVIDSTGISFANFLQWLMQEKMQVNFDGLTMLMMVLFVGHKKDGSSETVQSVMIPAIFNEIGVDLNDTRGVYSCKLFPLIGATSNQRVNPKWTHIGTASTFFSGENKNTLEDVLESFEKRLNIESYKYYKEISGTNKGFGRPVQYMITIPDSWKGFKFNGPGSNAAAEVDFKTLLKREEESRVKKAKQTKEEKAKEQRANDTKTDARNESQPTPKDSHVSVQSDMTITEVLDFVFKQTPDVAKLANFGAGDTSKNIKFYKNLVSVTSDDESITVHVDVVEFVVPRVLIEESNDKNKQNANKVQHDEAHYNYDPVTQTRRPKNYLVFDYIFSGKNLDVLSLDLKIQNLVWLLASKANLGSSETNFQSNSSQQVQDDGDGVKKDTVVSNVRSKDPILIPMRSNYEKTNFSNLSAATGDPEEEGSPQTIAQKYVRNLSKFYNGGGAVAKMDLRGNPDLMVFVALSDIQVHTSAVSIDGEGNVTDPNRSVKKTYREEFERTLVQTTGAVKSENSFVVQPIMSGTKPVGSPVYIKVRVYGPNVDFRTNELLGGRFATELLYDNFYWLASIDNKISGSKFTQELELQTFNVYGAKSAVGTGDQTQSKPKTV